MDTERHKRKRQIKKTNKERDIEKEHADMEIQRWTQRQRDRE